MEIYLKLSLAHLTVSRRGRLSENSLSALGAGSSPSAADRVLQLPAKQSMTDACRLDLTGNLSKAQLDFKPAFFSLQIYQGTEGIWKQNQHNNFYAERHEAFAAFSLPLLGISEGSELARETSTEHPTSCELICKRKTVVSLMTVQTP